MKIRDQFIAGFATVVAIGFGQPALPRVLEPTEGMRGYLTRTAGIDWRLRRAAVKDCGNPAKSIGMSLDAESAYAGYRGDNQVLPEIIGLAPRGAAQAAGLEAGDRIVSIGGRSVSVLMTGADGAQLPENIFANIDQLAELEGFHLEIERAGVVRQVDLAAEEVCPGLTIVRQSERGDAYSDLHNIAVTTGLLDRLASDDAVAFVIGHELAHTIYADSERTGLSRLRKERRADLFGVHIAACAGFDPLQALEALTAIKSMNIGDIFSVTHPSYRKRRHAIAQYLAGNQHCDAPFDNRQAER